VLFNLELVFLLYPDMQRPDFFANPRMEVQVRNWSFERERERERRERGERESERATTAA